jgi:hypothetical protein
MRALSARLPLIADEAKRVVANAALDSLFENTPADTSTLISNWRVTSGSISPPIPAYSAGKLGSSREASVAEARSAASAAMAAIPPGKPIIIYNSVPYAGYVNDGNATHAPLLFLERARLVGRLAGSMFKRSVGVTRG